MKRIFLYTENFVGRLIEEHLIIVEEKSHSNIRRYQSTIELSTDYNQKVLVAQRQRQST